jgi:hypothetical protein
MVLYLAVVSENMAMVLYLMWFLGKHGWQWCYTWQWCLKIWLAVVSENMVGNGVILDSGFCKHGWQWCMFDVVF